MRILIRVMMLVLLVTSVAQAQEVTLTSKVKSIYLGANGAEFYNDSPVLQTDLFAVWKSGVYADLWTSTAGNTELKFDKEIDLTLGRSGKFGRVKYATDVQYYFIQGINVMNGNLEVGAGSAFVRLEGYAPVKSGGPYKGWFISAGSRNDLRLASKIHLDVQEWVKHDSGAFSFGELWLIQGYIGLSASVTDKTNIVGGVKWSKPISEVERADGRKEEARWEIGMSRRF